MGSALPATPVPGDVLVERADQLDALSQWAADAAGGAGRLVLISGEAGIGKSALVEHFRPGVPDAEWLQGACDSLFTPRPLGPLFDMATDLGADLETALRSGAEREFVFSGFLERITTPGRLHVVVVEDIHWADTATLDLLRYVAGRIQSARTLVIGTFRDEQAPAADHLRVVLGDLAHRPITRRIQLGYLSRDGVARLCGGDGPDPDDLHRLTEWNPFFLSEILSYGGAVSPVSVQDAVLARLVGLSKPAREVLEVAALVGLRVDPTLLSQASDATVDTGAGPLDELVDRGLLIEDSTELRFRHEIARLTIADSIPPRRRTALHRHILSSLNEVGSDDDALLAFHAVGADDQQAVLVHSHRAARMAARAGSMREAEAHFRRALSVAPEDDPRMLAVLHDGLADAVAILKDYESAVASREHALAIWERLGATEQLADSLQRGVWVLNAAFRFDDARAFGRRAVELMEPGGASPCLARAHAALARVLMIHDHVDESLRHAAAARLLAEELGLDEVLSSALNTEACCLASVGQPWDATMRRSLALATQSGSAPLTARALYNTHEMLLNDLRPVEAAEAFPAAFDHAREHDLETFAYSLAQNQAMVLDRLGRWDEAMELATQFAAPPGDDEVRSVPATVVSVIAARRGCDPPAGLLERALEHAEASEQPQHLIPVRVGRAEVAWLSADRELAWKEIGRARDLEPVAVDLVRDVELWAHRTGLNASADRVVGPAACEIAGRTAAAVRAWEEACCPYDAAMALLGSSEEDHLRDAVSRFDALGAVAAARMARRKMRDLDFRSVPPERRASTRTHPKGLTVREREVLELVAAGLRNQDIADQLFVSPKTVATHVSSIMGKLGVLSRVEAAAWLHERGSHRE